jgi:hypothetical protein
MWDEASSSRYFCSVVLASFVRQRPDYGVPGERPIHLEEANSFLLREAKEPPHFRV